jgi:hypothetical protein
LYDRGNYLSLIFLEDWQGMSSPVGLCNSIYHIDVGSRRVRPRDTTS